MTRREELYPEIKRLREEEGLMWKEIAAHIGLSLSTVHDYYCHPTHEEDRARRLKYTGTCRECGARTNNGGAASGPPEVCLQCLQPEWTKEQIIEALRDWGDDHGGIPPREVDTHVGYEGNGRLPYWTTVRKHFGSWNEGIMAAGYEALHCDRRPETQEAIEAALRAGERTKDIADRFGVTEQAISMRLRYRGMSIRDLRKQGA
jgi:predicted transcriptional regulator